VSAKIVVVGAGGHAKVVISTLQAAGYSVVAVFDDDLAKVGTEILGIPVAGPLDAIADGDYEFGVVAVGQNRVRKAITERVGLNWLSTVHPSAVIHPSVKLGAGVTVFAGAIIQPDTSIGDHAIINTAATVDHDCSIGDFAHIAPGAHLAGGVQVGEGTLLGIGSVVAPYLSVGAWTTVGAGGAVVRDLPDGVTALGIPARPK